MIGSLGVQAWASEGRETCSPKIKTSSKIIKVPSVLFCIMGFMLVESKLVHYLPLLRLETKLESRNAAVWTDSDNLIFIGNLS